MDDVLVSAREFAAVQSSLLTLLDRAHPFLARADLEHLPKTGTVTAPDGKWTFRRHGAGVKFVSDNGVVVDAHRSVALVGGIDAWRLAKYLSSIRKIDVSHRDVDKLLSERLKAGDLCVSSKDMEVYELGNLARPTMS